MGDFNTQGEGSELGIQCNPQELPPGGKAESEVEDGCYERDIEAENKHCGTSEISLGQHIQQKVQNKSNNLFQRLHPEGRFYKLRSADVLQLTSAHLLKSHESCSDNNLYQTFIQKLLMMDYRARCIKTIDNNEEGHNNQGSDDSFTDPHIFFFNVESASNKEKKQSEKIHPMDVQMATFYCADSFLKQLMVTKLSQCLYALPLLVPDPFTQQIEFPLWTFRQINKSWKIRNSNNETISQTQPIYKAETPMVFFFRFGSVSSFKSQLMNSLINEKHNTFFHRHCPGSSKTRVLMDGVVEIAWFCPSGSYNDKFSDCVAFCNLHGDGRDHEKQLEILTEMSTVNVVLLPRLQSNDRNMKKLNELYKASKPLICLFTEYEYVVNKNVKGKFQIGLKDRNQSEVSEELRKTINNCLSESSSTFKFEDVSKYTDIRVDEEDNEDCRRGREAAQQMISLLEKKSLMEIKESFLPHQGKLWHQWSQKNKELHRPQADETETDISRKQTEMKEIIKQQHESDISEFVKFFIKQMNLDTEYKMFFIKWLRILLSEYISTDFEYDKKLSTVLKLKENPAKAEENRISEDLQASAFGLEHIVREIGQIYESCSFVKKNKKDLQVHFSSLPGLAAEMMISGSPLELMDGDAAHVPLVWISAVLDELVQKLGDQRVFVLSVLGLQSSGKSTMLNAMFGLQFAVSAGRCTRGAFMQLVKVPDEMKRQMNVDYILVVDTEGLRALELAGRSTRDHDNELATFVVGIGNMTLVNIFGENLAEMQDILQIVVQAFMRMKKVRMNPSCVFVHQNVSDVTAREKTKEGRRRLQEKLDEMTKLAAEEEDYYAECFSDVIRFDVQKDVKYFAHLWEGNPPMAPPNPKYCENILELKETIMSQAAITDGIKLSDLKVHIKDLWEALLNEKFVFSFRNSLEISAYRKLETEYKKWSGSLHITMMEAENKLHNKIENGTIHEVKETDLHRELKETSEKVEKSMSEFFEKNEDKDILIQWKASFAIKIKELQDNIVRETKRKLNEILQQQSQKKEIDAKRIHLENTLYEKSKAFPSNLKVKAKNEETLKKQFDLFWGQSVETIISDTPPINDIDIMRDVREILSDGYNHRLDDQFKEDSDYINIFTVWSFFDYVIFKKSSKRGLKEAQMDAYRSVKGTYGQNRSLSPEIEAQISSLVMDVDHQTGKMIQSFNISKMGYNISYIEQLTRYINEKVKEHEKESVKYKFKNDFFIDLVVSICKKANKMITDQYRLFREANDPVIYLEKKREDHYNIIQKYSQEAPSSLIFAKIICQKLKEPIEQSVYKKTARDLTYEIMRKCKSLNGNKLNMEKHILKTLAEEEDFVKYIDYMSYPRHHFKSFIREEVSQYITDQFSVSVLPLMNLNIKFLQQKIMEAAHQSTEDVQENRGDAGLWLKSFTQQLSYALIFSEKDLTGVKHDDVDDFNLLKDVIEKELPALMSEIISRFSTDTFREKLDYKFRPNEILTDLFCQCCWAQCPFCGATCTNTIAYHDGDHSVPFHRSIGLTGIYYNGTSNLCTHICTSAVASNSLYIYPNESNDEVLWKDYRSLGGVYAEWSITPDFSELPYWKWFVCRFQRDLEKHYDTIFEGEGKIPDEWRKYTKLEAIECLEKSI